jgi:hypothetical protein
VNAVAAVAALESRDATGRGLRIEFFQSSDRYVHRILAVGCEELPVILLDSIEGTSDEPWPPSPAFQALNLDDLHDCANSAEFPAAAMLVGMSGSTHWSMTVKPLANAAVRGDLSEQTGFYFDVAGRLKSVPKVLSTRYAVGKRVRAKSVTDKMQLHFGSGQSQLDSRTAKGTIDPTRWQLNTRASELGLNIVLDPSQIELPTTFRWGYALLLREE